MAKTSEEARRFWDRKADSYDRAPLWLERMAIGDSRAWISRAATGRTLEVAAGTGRNLPYYSEGVTLTATDLSARMLDQARRRAAACGLNVDFREADAARLPFADATFDTVVCTLAVCAVPDRETALDEMVRVLRPGGQLLLLDHAERRWRRGRPATLGLRRGLVAEQRDRMRLGLIERVILRKP